MEEEVKAQLPVDQPEPELPTPSFWEKLKANRGKILGGILGLLVFAGAVFSGYKFLRPKTVNAAEIIKKSLEKILEKGTIYHHKASYYRLSLEPNQPEPTPTTYEIWDDQDFDRFKQEVIYPNRKRVIQVFDGDIRWDYNEEENTLRKDIYVYPDPKEREIKHGERLDLVKMYRDLLDNGILKAYEGELEGRKVWQVIDERTNTDPSYWNTFYFDKETFMLLQQEKWEEKEERKVRTEKMTYQIMESIPKRDLDIVGFFAFDYVLPEDTKVLERHFNLSTGYVESNYYPVTPTPDPTANWKAYTNDFAKFSLKYPPSMSFSETSFSEQEKQVVFEGPEGKLTINFAVPESSGWGGGCDPDQQTEIDFIGEPTRVCLTEEWLSQLYGQHPTGYSQVQISANFASPFSENKEIILEMLSTFKFCDPCPQFMPADPEACKGGTWDPGEIDECGCQGPPRCVRETAP